MVFKRIFRKALSKKASVMPMLDWAGTQTDLMEVVYMIYLTGMLKNQKGRTATISEVTTVVFQMFNMPVPKNPTKIIDNLKHRMNPDKVSILRKVLSQLYHIR